MNGIVLGMQLAILAGVYPLARWMSRSKRWSAFGIGISFFSLFAYLFFEYDWEVTFRIFPAVYLDVESWWYLPFALLFFLLVYFRSSQKRLRVELLIICALLVFHFAQTMTVAVPNYAYHDLTCRYRNLDSPCIQSTFWSCGPAALVNFLALYGIHTTEREMAEKSHTVPSRGTSDLGMAYALSQMVPSNQYQVRYEKVRDLNRCPQPFLTSLAVTSLINHATVVLSVDPKEVKLLDSLSSSGPTWEPREKFMKEWKGYALYLVRRGR